MGTDKRARQKELSRTRAEEARKAAEAAARRRRFVNMTLAVVLIGGAVFGLVKLFGDDDSTTAASKTTTTVASPTTTGVADTTALAPGESTTTTTAKPGTAPCPAADGSSEKKQEFDGPPVMCIDPAKSYTAEIETNHGNLTVQLDAAKAPKTVNNFVFLARYHYYDGVKFHRIIKDFMFQGGDPTATGSGGPGYQFPDELPQEGEYQKYSVAMANSGPNTNGSQFFVITGPQGTRLPPDYSLFGKVVDGFDVADEIGAVATDSDDRPKDDVVMKKVTITEE